MNIAGRIPTGAISGIVLSVVLPWTTIAASSAPVDPLPTAWQPIGTTVDGRPAGFSSVLAGRVTAIAVLPGSSPTEVVGTNGGIWEKSGSGSWVDVTSPSWPSTAVSALAIDPSTPQVLYAGTGSDDSTAEPGEGILKSSDGGTSWQPLPGSEPLMRGYAVNGLVVDPLDHQVVVAAAQNGLFRSADGGATWNEVVQVTPNSFGVAEVRLAVDPVTGTILAGVAESSGIVARLGTGSITTGHAVYRSTDGGVTWSPIALDARTSAGDVVQPGIATSGGVTYAYALDITGDSANGLYTSADAGQTWSLRTTQDVVTKATIAVLTVDPRTPTTAYFAQDSGPFQYTWGSSTATPVTSTDGSRPQFGDWRALVLAARGAGRALYGGTDGGPCLFDLTVLKFVDLSAGLTSEVDFFASASSATSELTGAQDLGVDANRGGQALDLYNSDAYGVLIDQSHPTTYYAAVNGSTVGYVVSLDSGKHWKAVHLTPRVTEPYYMRPVQAAGDPNVIVLPESNGTLHISSDDGTTWTSRKVKGLNGDYLTIVRSALIPGSTVPVLFAGTGFGRVWRSPDLGVTWTKLRKSFSLSIRDLAIDAASSTGSTAEHVVLAIGVFAPVAYASGGTVGDVQRTTDSGATWTDIGQSLSSVSVNAVLVSGGTVVVGTDRGVLDNAGGTWAPAGTGIPTVRVNDLTLSQDGKEFFATTWGRGTWSAPSSG